MDNVNNNPVQNSQHLLKGQQRLRVIPQAVLLGLLAGLVSVGFQLAMNWGAVLRDRFVTLAHQHGVAGVWAIIGVALIAVILSVSLVSYFAPEASGSGIPHVKEVLLYRRPFRWLRVLITKILSTVIASTGGMALSREGPCVHLGAAIGQGLANLWPGKGIMDHSILVAAGGGAGLTSAFNAPLSGLTFVLEELEIQCTSLKFFAAAVACLTADTVCRALQGQYPVFHFTIFGAPPMNQLFAFIPLGIITGLLGRLFTYALIRGQKLTLLPLRIKILWWLTLSLMITVSAWYKPELLGGGQNIINSLLNNEKLGLQSVLLFVSIRFVLTISSASSGASGGFFMPILVLGALLGWGTGEITQLLFPEFNVDLRLFAVVGMAANFCAIIQAPLTGIMLMIEMTNDYALILPLFIAGFTALMVAGCLETPPIYDALVENDLTKKDLRR